MLENMEHRGGKGCNVKTGDGAGILIQLPHEFLSEEASRLGFELPAPGKYGVGMVFFPRDKKVSNACRDVLKKNIAALGFELIGFRGVPVDHSVPGPDASEVEPVIEQVFVKAKPDAFPEEALERKLRKRSYIRDSFAQSNSASTSSICRIHVCAQPSRWCIPASRPIRFRTGNLRNHSDTLRTTARSIRSAVMSTK